MTTAFAPEFRGGYSPKGWHRLVCFAAILLAFAVWGESRGSERLEPWPGRELPSFSLESLEGSAATLADHRGAPVLVHYFATWCIPCRRELPALAALASRFPAPQLKIFVISVAEPDVRVKRFFETLPVPFPVLLDRQRAAARQWGIDVLPTTILFDDRLQPRLFVEGEFDWRSEAAAQAVRSLVTSTHFQKAPNPLQEKTP